MNWWNYLLLGAAASALIAALLTPLIAKASKKLKVIDDPAIERGRREHKKPIPLGGGVAIWVAISSVILFFTFLFPLLGQQYLASPALVTIIIAGAVLLVGGYLDDRYKMSAGRSLLFPILAAILVVVSGIGVHFVTNPFGGVWRIDRWKIPFSVGQVTLMINLGVDLFTFAWIMGMMYTTKLLDGLDGLVSGVTGIAATVIMFLSLAPPVLQNDTALLAAIVAGAFFGFLPFNWSPAKIFLGEGGSLFAGFVLGVLAIVAGGKMATMLLVIGVPVLDVVAVLIRRFIEHRRFSDPDRSHLHFLLRDRGLSTKQTVLTYYAVALLFGIVALSSRSFGKFIALVILTGLLILVITIFLRQPAQKNHGPI